MMKLKKLKVWWKKKSIVQNKNSAIHNENECDASITCELWNITIIKHLLRRQTHWHKY